MVLLIVGAVAFVVCLGTSCVRVAWATRDAADPGLAAQDAEVFELHRHLDEPA